MRPGVTLHNGKPVDGKLVKENQEFLKASELTKRPYDPIEDFTPVTLVTLAPLVLASNPSVPVKSVKELVDVIGM